MNEHDAKVYELYDEYCHGRMERREFLRRAAIIAAAAGVAGCVKGADLLPDYGRAQTVSFTDPRIKARYVMFDSPGGNAPQMRGYLVQPQGQGPFPAVLVVHENRGRNPYVEDVTRRAAVAGFLALAPDALWALGGYPGNDDDGKVMQRRLDKAKIYVDMVNSARYLKAHPRSNGKLGVTGFCFGGAVSNHLAVALGADLRASAPFYGRPPQDLADVAKIRATMLLHYAEKDPRVNATRAAYVAALEKHRVAYEVHTYPQTLHGFHNNSTPRYDPAAAKLAWQRTIDLFKRTLA